jgi:hypothetical protein
VLGFTPTLGQSRVATKGLVSSGKCISKKRQSQAVKEEAQVVREKPR